MKRLRFIFICLLLILGLLVWRELDVIVLFIPNSLPYSIAFTIFSLFFLAWPIKLLRPEIKARWILAGLACICALSYFSQPLSSMATADQARSHCGRLTFTSVFYIFHPIVPSAFQDDLEARNQLCWVRKMILQVPDKFDSDIEIETYSKLTTQKLLSPEHKYRVTLPLIFYLWGKILSPFSRIQSGKEVLDKFSSWSDLYQIEISERSYEWYEWPYSSLIKFEYGLVEKNWEKIRIETQD